MRKYGKYEKRPEGVPGKQKKVKNMLLQTYFTGLICLILCVSMFFGTSYAWFTSEVKNEGNEIYIGTLNVDLQNKDGRSLNGSDEKIFDNTVRWEPGYTALETIKVVDKGNLAFKYELRFIFANATNGGNTYDALPENVANCFDMWVKRHQMNQDGVDTYTNPTSYENITAADSGWHLVGKLTDVLKGKVVLSGEMLEADVMNKDSEHMYTIALHMNEEATKEVMGYKIGLNVKLVAYQMASEIDGLGGGHDNITIVNTPAQLKEKLADGGNTLLTSDISIANVAERVTMRGGVLDGNGMSITYSGEKAGNYSAGVVTTTGGTVCNLTIVGGSNGRALYITNLESDLYVSDCTLSGAYSFNLNTSQATEYTLNFTNTKFESWTSYGNVVKHAYFTGCTFENVLKPYGDTTLVSCKLNDEMLDVSALVEGEIITLINCIYGDTVIEKAVITMTGGTIEITDSNRLTMNEGMIVLTTQ